MKSFALLFTLTFALLSSMAGCGSKSSSPETPAPQSAKYHCAMCNIDSSTPKCPKCGMALRAR